MATTSLALLVGTMCYVEDLSNMLYPSKWVAEYMSNTTIVIAHIFTNLIISSHP